MLLKAENYHISLLQAEPSWNQQQPLLDTIMKRCSEDQDKTWFLISVPAAQRSLVTGVELLLEVLTFVGGWVEKEQKTSGRASLVFWRRGQGERKKLDLNKHGQVIMLKLSILISADHLASSPLNQVESEWTSESCCEIRGSELNCKRKLRDWAVPLLGGEVDLVADYDRLKAAKPCTRCKMYSVEGCWLYPKSWAVFPGFPGQNSFLPLPTK